MLPFDEIYPKLDFEDQKAIGFKPKDMVMFCQIGLLSSKMCADFVNGISIMNDLRTGVCYSLNFNESLRSEMEFKVLVLYSKFLETRNVTIVL